MTPRAARDFLRFDHRAQEQFVRSLGRIAHRQFGEERFKNTREDQAAHAGGARFMARASKELRIMLDASVGYVTIQRLVHRHDKAFFKGEW